MEPGEACGVDGAPPAPIAHCRTGGDLVRRPTGKRTARAGSTLVPEVDPAKRHDDAGSPGRTCRGMCTTAVHCVKQRCRSAARMSGGTALSKACTSRRCRRRPRWPPAESLPTRRDAPQLAPGRGRKRAVCLHGVAIPIGTGMTGEYGRCRSRDRRGRRRAGEIRMSSVPIVIVGGGFAGFWAAAAARRVAPKAAISLLSPLDASATCGPGCTRPIRTPLRRRCCCCSNRSASTWCSHRPPASIPPPGGGAHRRSHLQPLPTTRW